jgi:hypothetical protein
MHRIKSYFSYFLLAAIMLAIFSCNGNKQKPDVSNIRVKLETVRFEKDFFSLDTNNFEQSISSIREKHHDFFNDFVLKILALEGTDTAQWDNVIKKFYADYKPIYDSTLKLDKEIDMASKKIEASLRYVKYYFPQYKLPEQFITFIAPMDAFAYSETGGSGDILTTFAIGAGLQLHLGAESMVYNSEAGLALYPEYLSRKFNAYEIPCNAMRVIIDDIIPPMKQGGKMIDILVDHGKRMYLLDLFMPDEKEEIKFGYTAAQLKAMKENEGFVWNYFTENNLLYEADLLKTRSFVSDGPSTSEFGLGSPGFVSLFIGKKLVDAYMKKKPETTLQELISTDAGKILSVSGYKPR